jgi:hypothetical protein
MAWLFSAWGATAEGTENRRKSELNLPPVQHAQQGTMTMATKKKKAKKKTK